MRFLTLLTLALLLLNPVTAGAQSNQNGPQMTAEQREMLDRLPAAQRDALMRQYDQQSPGARDRQDSGEPTGAFPGEAGQDGALAASDSVVIEIAPEPRPDGASRPRRDHLLEGIHTVKLDREGRLSLPGLIDIPVAGLTERQAALRLAAEPTLRDMRITVTRLPLRPTGREALRPFGYEIFSESGLPDERRTTGVPVSADYLVGPGDTITLQLYGKEDQTTELSVTPDGYLQVPALGPVAVAGMRFADMKQAIERRIQEQRIGVQAHVAMGELRSIEIFVFGDVRRPGQYPVGGMSTVLDALYAARGISRIGSLRDVRVIRGGKVATRVDLYEMLLHGRGNASARLEAGDIVFVPAVGPRVGVDGEVQRPAWYELRGDSTVAEVIAFAGNPRGDANTRRIRIERVDRDSGETRVITVDLATESGRSTAIRNGDFVSVSRVGAEVRNGVVLRGHFTNPGLVEWRNGMRLSDVMTDRARLKPDPDFDYGLVVRQMPDGRGVDIKMFAPRAVLDDPESADNLLLRPRDEILVFAFDDLTGRRALIEPLIERLEGQATRGAGAQVATVSGSVRAPGTYPLADGMTLTGLVRAGGGLAESAFLDSAELTRFEVQAGRERSVEHLAVSLGNALEGDPVADMAVRPHDVLTVKSLPQWAPKGLIEIRGEVRFPGIYPVRTGEFLSSVIERAGGLTNLAHAPAAVFTRETLRRKEQEQIDQMINRLESELASIGAQGDPASAQARSVSSSLVSQLRSTRPVGRLVIQLRGVIEQPGDPNLDVLVQDGDRLVIPSRPQEITVFGEVNFPTSHIYEPGLDFSDYIQRSGGMTYRADDGRIYVVRANGAVEPLKRRSRVFPGDTIVVPVDAERLPPMVRFMNISQVVYQLAIAAAAWQSLGVL